MPYVPLDADAEARRQAHLAAGVPPLETLGVDEARALLDKLGTRVSQPTRDLLSVEDISGDGVAMRLYRPRSGDLPTVLFCHGGGWVLRTLDDYDALCGQLATRLDANVMSIGYRLAPEHRFPAAIDDTASAIRWVADNAATLQLDTDRLVFAGDSAGGNLMAVAALMARDGDLPAPRAQVLFYPVTDATRSCRSHNFAQEGLVLSGKTMDWFCGHYLRPEQETDWRASPLLANGVAGVAPCIMLTVGADPLRDEGMAYATRLIEAGISVSHLHYSGQPHAFLSADPSSERTAACLREVASLLACHLGPPDKSAD